MVNPADDRFAARLLFALPNEAVTSEKEELAGESLGWERSSLSREFGSPGHWAPFKGPYQYGGSEARSGPQEASNQMISNVNLRIIETG